MIFRALALVAVMTVLSACVPSRPAPPQDGQPAAGKASTHVVASMDGQRDIVLAVANPLEPPATHAGSSLLGYASSGNYGAGQRATATLAELKQSYGLREITGWPIKALGLYCVVLEPPAGMTREALLDVLNKDRRVQLAQPLQDYAVYSEAPQAAHQYNDPYVNLQRGFVDTEAAIAHGVSQGEGVHIAVVDTGVDATHPDLQGSIHDMRNLVDDDTIAFTHDRHGTEIAGIITAVGDNHQGIVGIAPKATLSVYKACWYAPGTDAGAHCNTFTLAKAMAAVMDTDARIVNLSLGGPADPLLSKLLALLLTQGRIVVAAMPPDGGVDGFPDGSPGVIVVRTSGKSAASPGILSAPGNDILTTQPNGGYDFTSGSSMAAAHVTGIIALLLPLAPRLDAATVRDILLRSSKNSDGAVQVNAASAVATLRSSQNKAR
ncbi:S8 family serine peptidase [Dyella soli]|uniref:Serine protease n=1 Tax=Dyella soli TaxID=522319 RepID=A0A4R0YV68_9GAMM|nr:S8 family serine peptidase [Dyella soli]TCI10230.1 serine protease [Dyella soli]